MEEWSVVHKVALWGFLGAFLFGIIAHKTHFCTMGAMSDWINMGSLRRLRAWLLAMAVALLVTQLLQALGWIDLSASIYLSPNFGIGGHVVGGFLFGVGMTLGGGCGQRTLVRAGGGNLKSLVLFHSTYNEEFPLLQFWIQDKQGSRSEIRLGKHSHLQD